jgi:hypothetical protein
VASGSPGARATHFTGYYCWVHVGPRAINFTGHCCWFMWGLGQHTLQGIVDIGLHGASGNTLCWVLLLVHVGPRATHLLYWILLLVYVGARATHFTGYCCWLTWGLVQHTSLGIVVGLRGDSGNTLYWVLLLVYVGPRATHFSGYCCWFMWGLWQHTLLLLG